MKVWSPRQANIHIQVSISKFHFNHLLQSTTFNRPRSNIYFKHLLQSTTSNNQFQSTTFNPSMNHIQAPLQSTIQIPLQPYSNIHFKHLFQSTTFNQPNSSSNFYQPLQDPTFKASAFKLQSTTSIIHIQPYCDGFRLQDHLQACNNSKDERKREKKRKPKENISNDFNQLLQDPVSQQPLQSTIHIQPSTMLRPLRRGMKRNGLER